MHLPDKLKQTLASPPFQVVARLILGGLFIYASLDKIAQPMQFTRAIESYKLLPVSLLTLPALILPWAELLAGICLISGIWVRSAAMLLSALLLMFILALGLSALRGLKISCGCFTTKLGEGDNIYLEIFRDLLMLIPAWVILFFGREKKDS
jgi:uncharacterized membrane protein YphA (DoxX/SURF4 family)